MVEPADHVQVLFARQVLVDRRELPGETDEAADDLRFGDDVVSEHPGDARGRA